MSASPLLSVKDLKVSFGRKKNQTEIIQGVSFDLKPNSILGLVGESGSGKSVTSLAIMGLLPAKTSQISGELSFEGQRLDQMNPKELRDLRGREISMIFQEPMTALNPSIRCGKQVAEVMKLHLGISSGEAKNRVISLFNQVQLPRPKSIYRSYPHQLSGGQMQRVMIAMALACKPKLLVADEPTTALDVTVQKEIIHLLKELQQENGMSIIFISHDLNLVSEIADEVVVMYQGNMVEKGSMEKIFKQPEATYTKALIEARPDMNQRLLRLPTISSLEDGSFVPSIVTEAHRAMDHKQLYTQPPILEVKNLKKEYYSKVGMFGKKETVKAVNKVSFSIYEGETVGLVGESGCGKSTLGKSILLLEEVSGGSIKYRGKEITRLNKEEVRELRKEIQLIFQDPFSSLNPRIMIGPALVEAMKVHQVGRNNQVRKQRALNLLEKVGLSAEFFDRYPHQLSGGQRQRVGIARAVCLSPRIIICDESVSALDISVQAQVLNLLNELKEDLGFTYLFISHDLAVVKYMSDQLLVMQAGELVEIGDADEIYANPNQEYTRKLIDAIPKGI
ncbi:ABC transporter ATP-binding protein [Aureitalea marina]|uniref:ABC transporter ATP-binding protein n=1 Tax=Aureitalea marina TaxID=930804 RepID=A0A2S7KSC9_9FLAO|nr:ABC transporter ATP-binding protein [Aureitalea marina]PQB05531.1 ABC transporter ATP-binding protein [Aureitalea marina]